MQITVGIDVDGILRDFITGLTAHYEFIYPDHWTKPVTGWSLHNYFEIGKGIYDFVWKKYPEECIYKAPIYDGAYDFIKALDDKEYSIAIVSDQPNPKAKRFTFEWLYEHGILDHADHVIILDSNERFNKGSINVDVLIDDHTRNLEYAHRNHIKPLCLDRPWNQDWKGLSAVKYNDLLHGIEIMLDPKNTIV